MRIIKLIVALTLTLALLGACASPAPTSSSAPESSTPQASADAGEAPAPAGPDTSEPVNLVAYFLGDGSADDQMVFDELNKKTSELINTTFERRLISWADFNTMYPLVFASGEDFDLIFTSNWSFYAQMAVKDGFYELTDEFLSTYAPNISANVPDTAWKQARINGKIYMVPNTESSFNYLSILVRGDLRKKHNLPEITSLENFELYLDTIAQNESGILPLDAGSEFDKWVISSMWFTQPNGFASISALPGYVYDITDPNGKLHLVEDMPEYKEYLARMVDFNNRGYWSKNALNQQNRLDDNFKNGTSAAALHNDGTIVNAWRDVNKNHPEWEAEIYDGTFGNYPTVRSTYLGNGMAIHARSKNPERAMMWLDTIRFNRECYDLMMSGIEGVHWVDEGNNMSGPGPKSGEYGGFSNWGFTTDEMKRTSVDEWPGRKALLATYEKNEQNCPAFYFLFDDSDCKNETAAMSNITLKYGKMLDFGFDPNWEKTLADVTAQYENAGREKVKSLFETQLADFLQFYNAE